MMTVFRGKNIASFMLSLLLAAIFAIYAFSVASGIDAKTVKESYFSINDDGSFMILGNHYRIPEKAIESAEEYFAICAEINGAFLPEFFTESVKKAAEAIGLAAKNTAEGLGQAIGYLIRGNM